MVLFDTHAHFEGTEEETSAVLERAARAGVGYVAAIGGSETLNAGAADAARIAAAGAEGEMPRVFKAVGWDRDQAGKTLPPLDFEGAAAVGEIGLDYHYGADTAKAQRELFVSQLDKARALGLPAVVHTREADEDTLAALKEVASRGIIHSFTGSTAFCGKLLDLGFFISLSGIVTFRLADNVREIARYVPLDRMLVETDSPYLAPVPMRGKRNEPAFVVHTARFVAEHLGIAPEKLAETTTRNALSVFSPG